MLWTPLTFHPLRSISPSFWRNVESISAFICAAASGCRSDSLIPQSVTAPFICLTASLINQSRFVTFRKSQTRDGPNVLARLLKSERRVSSIKPIKPSRMSTSFQRRAHSIANSFTNFSLSSNGSHAFSKKVICSPGKTSVVAEEPADPQQVSMSRGRYSWPRSSTLFCSSCPALPQLLHESFDCLDVDLLAAFLILTWFSKAERVVRSSSPASHSSASKKKSGAPSLMARLNSSAAADGLTNSWICSQPIGSARSFGFPFSFASSVMRLAIARRKAKVVT
mmetsp:Transcript_19715/g.49504  ORF Transcript_19715/g.49504 Transcript_19715/m.49504 type:complete len:281 (-) Transcript_19715:866-1708(-)